MTETVPSVWFATKRRVPFGVIVHPRGSSPTGISPITVNRVSPASETTDTVPLAPLVTKASLPAGSTATKRGATPTGTSASFAKTSRSPLRTCSTARLFASRLTATTSLSFFVILMVLERVGVRKRFFLRASPDVGSTSRRAAHASTVRRLRACRLGATARSMCPPFVL